jgi:ATP-dependent Clp protease ATP-binding subunit ClpC
MDKFERLSQQAQRTIACAQREAKRRNHQYVGSEHLLLGVVNVGGFAADVLAAFGVDFQQLSGEVDKLVNNGLDPVTTVPPLTPRGRVVIGYAHDEALHLNDREIDIDHILLGLLREWDGTGGQVMQRCGLDPSSVREAIHNRRGEKA